MRELVYLSDCKLEQFLPTLRSLWPRPKISFKVPVVEIGLEAERDDQRDKIRHLARVVAHIEKSALWFLDPNVHAGQWVHFEAPLNYLVLNSAQPDLVFFVDRNVATPDYPTGGAGRLVLHCSGTHLRIESQPAQVTAPPGEKVNIIHHWGSNPCTFSKDNIDVLLKELHGQGQPSDERQPPSWFTAWTLPAATSRLLRAIDARVHPETAAWMAGYARVTANFDAPAGHAREPVRHVIASPLYIEYAKPPRDT